MPHDSDDMNGRKPYKTYKAGHARRSALDDELAAARPARTPPRSGDGRAQDDPAGGHTYRRYGAPEGASDENSAGGMRGAQGRGAATTGKRRRFRWWHVPVGILLVLVIAAVVVTVLAWPGYKKFDRAVAKANTRLDKKTRAQLTPDNGWIWRNGTTLLLLGVDSKTGEPARSDTIMLMRFNPKTRTINQLSIPRDTRVNIAGHGYDKINEAMFWDWPSAALAVQTIKQYTGIPINHVMIVNFKGFPRLVNAVGGVDMFVPKTIETKSGSEGRTVVFQKGMHHFDGKYAMLYVRIRYADNDFHRAARQQTFVQALEKKITKLPEIGKRFMSGVATDLTTNQILELAYLKWRAKGGKKAVMVGATGYEGGVDYVFPPSEAARQKMVHQFLTN
jgi:polyisoprenyl-teichoic acid--peptidoglycan teichoic acid transferase